jgi:hypothetical protein
VWLATGGVVEETVAVMGNGESFMGVLGVATNRGHRGRGLRLSIAPAGCVIRPLFLLLCARAILIGECARATVLSARATVLSAGATVLSP